MRILNRYLSTEFLCNVALTFLIFTFIMSIGAVFKVSDLLARGVSWRPVLLVLVSSIPSAMIFSVPISILTTCLLLFGRLSADGEITAMRCSGISLWRILSRPLIVAAALLAFCIFLNNELAPRSHYQRREQVSRITVESPTEFLDEGRFIEDFAGLTVYIGRRDGETLRRIRIYDERTPGIKREVRARTGVMRVATNGTDLVLDLFDVRVDPFSDDRPGPAFCSRWSTVIPDALRTRRPTMRADDMTFGELWERMRNPAAYYGPMEPEERAGQRMVFHVEFNKRLALSFACVAFVLLGVPLGIKAHRKESSIGVAISLGLVFNFYLFIIVAENMARYPALRPDLVVWLPVVISVLLGAWLMERAN
jgi:lipopolysaccharide export system permease protein